MIIKNNLLKSNFLELQQIENKQLSIQFSLDGFSFCVTNLDLQEIVVFGSYSFTKKNAVLKHLLNNIKAVFLNEEILKTTFNKVLVIHTNNLATFVPNLFFDESQLSNYIKFNNRIYTTDYFTYEHIKNQEMVVVFAPYVHINNFLIDQYGSFEYKHHSSILVENLINKFASNGQNIFINVAASHFEIIVSENKNLILYNTFNYKTKEDFLYYILYTFEQLKLNTEETSITFLGAITENDVLYSIAYRYIRHISFLPKKLQQTSILEIDDIVKRENFALFYSL